VGSDAQVAFEIGAIMGAISAQTSSRGSSSVSRHNPATGKWEEDVIEINPFAALAYRVLASDGSSRQKLERLQLVHFNLIYGMSVSHPDVGRKRVEDAEKALRDFESTPVSQLTGFDAQYRKGSMRKANIADLTYSVNRARSVWENRDKVIFALLDAQSLEFKTAFVDAGIEAKSPSITTRACSRLGFSEDYVFRYFIFLADRGEIASVVHVLETAPGKRLSDAQYEDLFLRNLKAIAHQTIGALEYTPQHILTEAFVRKVFDQIQAKPYAGFPPVSSEEADWVPHLMQDFVRRLAERGIRARVVFKDNPTTEISTSQWNHRRPVPLVLLWDVQ
jgi:hypothetical protein